MSVINTNLKSLQAQDSLNINNRQLSTAMQRLSTGTRINSAADDAAGLSISSRMDSQIRGLNMAIKNANDAMSLTQTAEGAMDEVTNILQRMRELAVQSASDTNSAEDRLNLNQEIEQLSTEIDRISGTTQFNNMNILDGSFNKKVFQIGSNAGQTMGLSIGSMSSRVLGVASSTTTMESAGSTAAAGEVAGAVAQGVAPDDTVVKLGFYSSGSYSFALKDSVTGLEMSATDMGTMTVDLTSQLSKDYFVERINEKLADAQGDTTVTGSRVWTSTTTLDLTDTANLQKMKFTVQVDGEQVDVDVTQALLGAHPASGTVITRDDAVSAVEAALQLAFDDNLNVSAAATGNLKVEDAQGRRIEILQGAGDGFLFGTDTENSGGLLARETARNPISVAWDGDSNELIVSNSMGGKISLSSFSSDTSGVLFNVVNDSQVDGLFEPQWLSQSAAAVAPSMSAVTFNGNVEPTEISLRVSDLVGASANATTAMYTFKLTNGQGDTYGTFSVNMSQNLTDREDTIASVMKAELTSAVAALASAGDSTFDAGEFEITVAGDTIQIRNNAGRALAVEDFSSGAGYMVVTPMNEPASSETLASQNAYYSENRLKVNTGALGTGGMDFAGVGASAFTVTINGVDAGDLLTLNLSATGDLADGASLASAIQTQIRGATAYAIVGGAISATVQEVLSAVTVAWDADTSEIVIRDDKGRSIGFGWAASAQGGAVFTENFNVGNSNQGIATKLDSQTAQGDVYEATKVKMSLDADQSKFNFKLNGTSLDTSEVYWDAKDPFDSSTLKTKLDALMTKLNADHPRTVFEYSVSGRDITFLQRDGGPLEFSAYTTDDDYPDGKATLTPADGQGDPLTLAYVGHNTATEATAAGTLATTTSATLNLEGDDIYSLTVSDGTNSYAMSSTVLDISDNDSVNTFLKKLENTLDGSGIAASMDTNGNVQFSRADGGKIVLESFASATGRQGTWTPSTGQGSDAALSGGGAISVTPPPLSGAGGYTPPLPGGTSVKQVSIATQDGATKALSVIDKAISYVNTERSKLGAVVNRLTHTVDNLANIVTNTQASRSRIKDTDYAAETAELARTQIIQQAATAMLAQANQAPQGVLALLR